MYTALSADLPSWSTGAEGETAFAGVLTARGSVVNRRMERAVRALNRELRFKLPVNRIANLLST